MSIKAIVLTGDGVNCEMETALSFQEAGFSSRIVHINDLLARPSMLHDFHALAIPGGFSFGDDLGSGKVFAAKIKALLAPELEVFLKNKKIIIGICNGFQVLTSLGLFNVGQQVMSLEHNSHGHYINRWETMTTVDGNKCLWTKNINKMNLPIRHGEGRVVFATSKEFTKEEQFASFCEAGRVVLRYEGDPNGSDFQVAGVCDESGQVFGLMPHPEAARVAWQYPGGYVAEGTSLGQAIFENAASYVKENLV